MDDDLKVFQPEVIEENPFPEEEQIGKEVSAGGSNTPYSPTTFKPSGFPRKVIAQETIGQALNTKSRKILAEFEFASSGAIQIGEYENGVSGDLKISPAGIVARNTTGETSFALDGDTGDAVFRGIVQASDFRIVGGGIIGVVTETLRSQAGFTDIQSAIGWVHSEGGGTINIPAGTYDVTSNIRLYSDISLIGADDDTTILDFNGSSNQVIIEGTAFTTGGLIRNVRMSNLQFKDCYHPTQGAIYMHWATDTTIDNCKFSGNWNASASYGADIYKTGCQRISFIRCQSSLSGHFIYGVPVANTDYHIEISDCLFSTNQATIIYNPGSANTRIINCTFSNQDAGIGIEVNSPSPFHGRIMNNYFSGMIQPIKMGSSNCIISGNRIHGGNASSVDLIEIETAHQTIISNNEIHSVPNGYSGILVGANCDGTLITSNVISGGAGSTGVTVSASTADQTIIVANQFEVATDTANSGTGTVIANNSSL